MKSNNVQDDIRILLYQQERDDEREKNAMLLDVLRDVFEAVSTAESYAGCGDNSCLFVKPKGMATNGGCRCVDRGCGRPGLTPALGKLYRVAISARNAMKQAGTL